MELKIYLAKTSYFLSVPKKDVWGETSSETKQTISLFKSKLKIFLQLVKQIVKQYYFRSSLRSPVSSPHEGNTELFTYP